MFVFNRFLDKETCDYYKKLIETHYNQKVSDGMNRWHLNGGARVLDMSIDDPICERVRLFLSSQIKCLIECDSFQLQTWPINTSSSLHVHTEQGRENTPYTSMLYLNDDYDGGEFFTENGLTLKPKIGTLTFFNGKTTYHGVNTVEKNHRYTMIFWWKSDIHMK